MVVSCHRAPQAGGWPPWDYPCHFPFPSLSLDNTAFTGIPSTSWSALHQLGGIPQAIKPCSWPAWGPKKKPKDSDRDTKGLLDRAGSYLCTERFLEQLSHCVQEAEYGSRLPYSGEESAAIYRGNWCQVGSSGLPGKPAWGRAKPAGGYGLSPIIKRAGEFCEWNRARSSRRCLEHKRMAILSGLTMHRVKRHLLKS